MTNERIKVLYINGGGRSGSTLLLRLLGQLPGAVPVGELYHLWDWTLAQNQLCGCGEPIQRCPFWSAVLREAFGAEGPDIVRMIHLMRALQGYRFLPPLAVPALRSTAFRLRLQTYTDALGRLYRALHRVSGGQMIIDSSKNPWYALALKEIPDVDLHLVHVVRDSRAVAYSWQRRKRRPEVHWRTEYMTRYHPLQAAGKWTLANGFAQVLPAAGVAPIVLRYEDLVHAPSATLLRLGEALGEAWGDVDFFGDESAAATHTVAGNPDRFQAGPIRIRPDVEWQQKMTLPHKLLVTALTWPLLLRYGYGQRVKG